MNKMHDVFLLVIAIMVGVMLALGGGAIHNRRVCLENGWANANGSYCMTRIDGTDYVCHVDDVEAGTCEVTP